MKAVITASLVNQMLVFHYSVFHIKLCKQRTKVEEWKFENEQKVRPTLTFSQGEWTGYKGNHFKPISICCLVLGQCHGSVYLNKRLYVPGVWGGVNTLVHGFPLYFIVLNYENCALE